MSLGGELGAGAAFPHSLMKSLAFTWAQLSNLAQTVPHGYVVLALHPLYLLPARRAVCGAVAAVSPGLSQHSCLQTLLISSSEGEIMWSVLYLFPSPTLILPNYRVFSFISFLGRLIVGELPTVSSPSTRPVFLLTRLSSAQNPTVRVLWWDHLEHLISHASL